MTYGKPVLGTNFPYPAEFLFSQQSVSAKTGPIATGSSSLLLRRGTLGRPLGPPATCALFRNTSGPILLVNCRSYFEGQAIRQSEEQIQMCNSVMAHSRQGDWDSLGNSSEFGERRIGPSLSSARWCAPELG